MLTVLSPAVASAQETQPPAVTPAAVVCVPCSTAQQNAELEFVDGRDHGTHGFDFAFDRLEKPGKERCAISGTLTRGSGPQASTTQIRVTWELPGQLRLEEQKSGQTIVTGFDGDNKWKDGGTPAQEDIDLIETLLNDTAEHLFLAHSTGFPTRLLGTRFRMDDGKSKQYTGPLYDIYQVDDHIKDQGKTQLLSKFYHVNSKTFLVEKVLYELLRNGSRTPVETHLGSWSAEGNQHFAHTISRLEKGLPVLTVTITSIVVSPADQDGMFNNPGKKP